MKRALIAIIGIIALWGVGFATPSVDYKVLTCTSEYTKYWVAEFSDTYLSMEGRLETDYWSEDTGVFYAVRTVNGGLVGKPTFPYFKTIHGYYVPEFYPREPSFPAIERTSEFDNYSKRTSHSIRVYAVNDEDSTEFSIGYTEYPKCIDSVDNTVSVSTWFWITYGSNF